MQIEQNNAVPDLPAARHSGVEIAAALVFYGEPMWTVTREFGRDWCVTNDAGVCFYAVTEIGAQIIARELNKRDDEIIRLKKQVLDLGDKYAEETWKRRGGKRP